MLDKISIDRIALLHPLLREEALLILQEIDNRLPEIITCRYTSTKRTADEQNKLYAQGRNGNPGPIVTKAKAWQSYHNYGLAIDAAILLDLNKDGKFESVSYDTRADYDNDKISDWMEIIYVFKLFGWEWAGEWKTFPEYPHFQKTFGYNIGSLMAMQLNGGQKDSEGYLIL